MGTIKMGIIKNRRSIQQILVLVLISLGVSACGPVRSDRWYDSEKSHNVGDRFFTVESNESQSMTGASSETIIIQQGDTYYRLSQKYGVATRDLIEANNARPPYALSAGQTLILPNQKQYEVQRGDTLYSISREFGVDRSSLARQNRLKAPYHLREGQRLSLAMAGQSPQLRQVSKPRGVLDSAPERKGRFIIPANGRIISTYGSKENGIHNDGINIAVPVGTDVKAAENGVIVYAGNELEGYGNLMLIRHADGFVTAYAHNKEFLARAGQKVKRGEVIARSGSSGNVTQPQIHFEIRKGARALNPQKLI